MVTSHQCSPTPHIILKRGRKRLKLVASQLISFIYKFPSVGDGWKSAISLSYLSVHKMFLKLKKDNWFGSYDCGVFSNLLHLAPYLRPSFHGHSGNTMVISPQFSFLRQECRSVSGKVFGLSLIRVTLVFPSATGNMFLIPSLIQGISQIRAAFLIVLKFNYVEGGCS